MVNSVLVYGYTSEPRSRASNNIQNPRLLYIQPGPALPQPDNNRGANYTPDDEHVTGLPNSDSSTGEHRDMVLRPWAAL